MIRKDVLFGDVNGKYDLLIRNGDFVIGESEKQHARHILEAEQGQYRQNPLIGVGVRKLLNGPFDGAEKRNIQLQLQSDAIKARKISYMNKVLKVDL